MSWRCEKTGARVYDVQRKSFFVCDAHMLFDSEGFDAAYCFRIIGASQQFEPFPEVNFVVRNLYGEWGCDGVITALAAGADVQGFEISDWNYVESWLLLYRKQWS